MASSADPVLSDNVVVKREGEVKLPVVPEPVGASASPPAPDPKSETKIPPVDMVIPAAPDLDADTFQKLDFLLEQTKTFVRFIDDAHAQPAPSAKPPAAKRARGPNGEAIPAESDADDDAGGQAAAGDASTCAAAATAAAAGALSAEDVPRSEQPKLVPLPIRRYQLAAVNWLESLYLNGFNGILADEMGLGKTVTTVSFFCKLWENNIFGPFLVVAPVSCLQNWMNEVSKWSGGTIPAILYHGTKEQRATLANSGRLQRCIQRAEQGKRAGEKGGCCVVTSYDIAMNDLKTLRRVNWQYVVVDEAHRLKNMHCKLITELRRLNTEYRLLLTGTPLQNNIAELWSLLNFILPAIFDDLTQFQKWFDLDSLMDEGNGNDDDDEEGAEGADADGGSGTTPTAATAPGDDEKPDVKPTGKEKRKTKSTAGYRSFVEKGAGPAAAAAAARNSRKMVLHSEQQTKILVKLHEILRPFVLRRLKSEVGLGLPSKREIALYCDMTSAQHAAMKALLDGTFDDHVTAVAASFGRAAVAGVTTVKERFRNVVMQLRKVCNHPFLFSQLNPFAEHILRHTEETAFDPGSDEDDLRQLTSLGNRGLRLITTRDEVVDGMTWEDPAQRAAYDAALVESSGKFRLLAEMLPVLRAAGHRVLIFSQMVSMLDLIEDHLMIHNFTYRRLDGAVPQVERQIRIEAFNFDASIFCFLVSTRAGGLGVNLTGADTVIIYDSDWNPQMDLQAQDRVHRIGQTKPVAVYRLLTANTVESYLMHRATQKLRLEHLVIEKGNFNRSRKGDVAIDNDTLKKLLDREFVVKMVNDVSRGEDSAASERRDLTVAAVAAGILATGDDDAEDKALAAMEAADSTHASQSTVPQRAGFEIVQDLASGF